MRWNPGMSKMSWLCVLKKIDNTHFQLHNFFLGLCSFVWFTVQFESYLCFTSPSCSPSIHCLSDITNLAAVPWSPSQLEPPFTEQNRRSEQQVGGASTLTARVVCSIPVHSSSLTSYKSKSRKKMQNQVFLISLKCEILVYINYLTLIFETFAIFIWASHPSIHIIKSTSSPYYISGLNKMVCSSAGFK